MSNTIEKNDPILDILNEEQKESVISDSKRLLIVAGPGTGKTSSITHRIAYLIRDKGVKPQEILAMTFTNKAAREMKNRIEQLCGDVKGMKIGTYHSYCCGLLRQYYSNDFSLWDGSDQRQALKIIKDPWYAPITRNVNPSSRAVLEYISSQKREKKPALDPQYFMQMVMGIVDGCLLYTSPSPRDS